MGCDIHSYVEQCDMNDIWHNVAWKPLAPYNDTPFDNRNYGVFGFLADVRNYSISPTIAKPRDIPTTVSKKVKEELEYWEGNGHSYSWLAVDELVRFNYEQMFEDRRIGVQVTPNYYNGAALAEPGKGKQVRLRDFLGEFYFKELKQLEKFNTLYNTRIIFWFDN